MCFNHSFFNVCRQTYSSISMTVPRHHPCNCSRHRTTGFRFSALVAPGVTAVQARAVAAVVVAVTDTGCS